MKKLITFFAVVVAVFATTTTAFAMAKADPVEVVADANGTREIITTLRFEPEFYCWGVWTQTDERRIMFNDGSVGYIFPQKGTFLWMPADTLPEKFTDSADFVAAIADYARCRYGQKIDGVLIPTEWGADYTYFIFGVEEYIHITERLYGVE